MRATFFLSLVFCLCLAPQAYAVGAYDFTFRISGDTNLPTLSLTNTGSAEILEFSVTTGNPNRSFDWVRDITATSGLNYTGYATQDTVNNGLRPSVVGFTFGGGFVQNATISFKVDLDKKTHNDTERVHLVMFNNGTGVPNSLLTVTYEGAVLAAYLPDFEVSADNTYSYSYSEANPTPIPGAAWLLGSGLVGLAGLRRRMRG